MTEAAGAFGALLRHYRRAAGLSQEALAERARLSVRGLSALERGISRAPRPSTLRLLERALGLSASQKGALEAAAYPEPTPGGRAPIRAETSSTAVPAAVPAPLSGLVGREQELAAVTNLLIGSGDVRLVTLTGPAGVGKTRLALAATARVRTAYPGGVRVVELAPLADPALVPGAVVSALDLYLGPGQPPLAALAARSLAGRLLLVLDNCEHLVEACGRLVETLLRSWPELHVLATSREVLGVAGEHVWRVPPLPLPPARSPGEPVNVERLLRYAAVRLFAERARAAEPQFALAPENAAHVADICRRLDGLPLALELAAARVRVLSAAQIARLLDDRFRLLTGGSRVALPRQQTLRAALDWSYDLLPAPERATLSHLAVFAGGCTLEAAEAVCAGSGAAPLPDRESVSPPLTPGVLDHLAHLVDKSLVQTDTGAGDARYHLLETIRLYGRERLREAGEEALVRDRHLAWCLALVERWVKVRTGPHRAVWAVRVRAERDNLWAALEWSLTRAPQAGLRLVLDMTEPGAQTWSLSESGHWLDRIAAAAPPDGLVRARALCEAALLYRLQERHDEAGARLAASEALFHELGDLAGLARVRTQRAQVAAGAGDAARAAALYAVNVAYYRAAGDTGALVQVLRNAGVLAVAQRDYDAARAALEESLMVARTRGDTAAAGTTLYRLGIVARLRGDDRQARALLEHGLALVEQTGQRVHMAVARCALGDLARELGDYAGARAQYDAVLHLAGERTGEPGFHAGVGEVLGATVGLCGHGILAVRVNEHERGVRLLGAALAGGRFALTVHFPDVLADVEAALDLARGALGPAAAEAAWLEGQSTLLEQAVAYVSQPAPAAGTTPSVGPRVRRPQVQLSAAAWHAVA